MRGISCSYSAVLRVTVSSEGKDDKLCSPLHCESHCSFQFSEHQPVPSQACFKHSTSHMLSFCPPPSRHSQLKKSMTNTLVIDKPVGKWLWKYSWLNVEHLFGLFCSSSVIPSYFFNCWPCKKNAGCSPGPRWSGSQQTASHPPKAGSQWMLH